MSDDETRGSKDEMERQDPPTPNGREPVRNSEAADSDRQKVSLLDLVVVIARRWRLIFFATFFVAIATVLFSLYTLRVEPDSPYNPLPDIYESHAQILLNDPGSGSVSANSLGNTDLGLLAGLTGLGAGRDESSAALAQELLRGNALVTVIVEEFDLVSVFSDAEAPLTAARNSVRAALTSEFDSASGILNVTYESIDPVFATDVLQRIVVLLESRFTYLTRDDARARTQAIELQLRQLEDDLQQARDALTGFQRRYGVIDPENQGLKTIDLIAQFRQRGFDLELEREQIFDLVQDRDDPQIRRINQDIRRIEELINELETGYRIYSPISIPLDQIGPLTVQYTELQRDMLLKEQVYSTFQGELIRARIESQDTARRFQVIESPEVPEVRSGPRRGVIATIATIAAFVVSVVLAFVLEYVARARRDPREARKLETIRNQFRRHTTS